MVRTTQFLQEAQSRRRDQAKQSKGRRPNGRHATRSLTWGEGGISRTLMASPPLPEGEPLGLLSR